MNVAGFDLMGIMPLMIMFVIFYFLLIRPQQNKLKAHQEMIRNIRRGDKVVTNGGLIGIVSKVTNDQELLIEISEGVKVRVVSSMIADVPAKPEPANTDKPSPTKKSKPKVVASKTQETASESSQEPTSKE